MPKFVCLTILWIIPEFARAAGMSLAVASSYTYDSNVFRSSSNAEASQYYQIQPSASASFNISKLIFQGSYGGRFAFYKDYPENNTEDLSGTGSVSWKSTGRVKFGVDMGYSNAALPRESIFTSVSKSDQLENSEQANLSVSSAFPVINNKYDLQLLAGISDQNFNGADAESKNKYQGQTSAELSYRYSGKTSMVYGYKTNINSLKSEFYRSFGFTSHGLYMGMNWLTSGKTSSHANIGYEFLSFSGPETSSYGGLTIDLSATWERKSYSKVNLSISRSSKDSIFYGTGFVVVNQFILGLSHSLTSRWSAGTGLEFYAYQSHSEYRHIGGSLGLSTRYSMRWLSVGFNTGYQHRYSLVGDDSHFTGYTMTVELRIAY